MGNDEQGMSVTKDESEGGDSRIVYLVWGVFLVSLVRRTKQTRETGKTR